MKAVSQVDLLLLCYDKYLLVSLGGRESTLSLLLVELLGGLSSQASSLLSIKLSQRLLFLASVHVTFELKSEDVKLSVVRSASALSSLQFVKFKLECRSVNVGCGKDIF